jgi:hypothetical protein
MEAHMNPRRIAFSLVLLLAGFAYAEDAETTMVLEYSNGQKVEQSGVYAINYYNPDRRLIFDQQHLFLDEGNGRPSRIDVEKIVKIEILRSKLTDVVMVVRHEKTKVAALSNVSAKVSYRGDSGLRTVTGTVPYTMVSLEYGDGVDPIFLTSRRGSSFSPAKTITFRSSAQGEEAVGDLVPYDILNGSSRPIRLIIFKKRGDQKIPEMSPLNSVMGTGAVLPVNTWLTTRFENKNNVRIAIGVYDIIIKEYANTPETILLENVTIAAGKTNKFTLSDGDWTASDVYIRK